MIDQATLEIEMGNWEDARSWDHPTHPSVKMASGRSLRPCLRQGASLGEEAVLADSGRAGEVAAGAGRVRMTAILSILREQRDLRDG
jgi:hypothetical protein